MIKCNKYLCDFSENQELLRFTSKSFYSFCFHEINYKMLADLTTGAVSSQCNSLNLSHVTNQECPLFPGTITLLCFKEPYNNPRLAININRALQLEPIREYSGKVVNSLHDIWRSNVTNKCQILHIHRVIQSWNKSF